MLTDAQCEEVKALVNGIIEVAPRLDANVGGYTRLALSPMQLVKRVEQISAILAAIPSTVPDHSEDVLGMVCATVPDREERCEWSSGRLEHNYYLRDTSCSRAIEWGSVQGYQFCPYCGRPISVVTA